MKSHSKVKLFKNTYAKIDSFKMQTYQALVHEARSSPKTCI